MSLPHGAADWSAVSDCGISRPYSLFGGKELLPIKLLLFGMDMPVQTVQTQVKIVLSLLFLLF